MKKFLLLGISLVFFFSSLFAQSVKGIIVTEKGKPIKSVKIWVKNSATNYKTNDQGEFIISELNNTDTLIISLSNLKNIVLPFQLLTNDFTIIVKKDHAELIQNNKSEKIPFIKKITTNYNPNVITREQIEQMNANSLYDLLRGITGVMVTENNGNAVVSIRGGTSFSLNDEPLFIIDGIEYENSMEADRSINIHDIEKIEIQKDGSAFGIKGANGAVIITTKKETK